VRARPVSAHFLRRTGNAYNAARSRNALSEYSHPFLSDDRLFLKQQTLILNEVTIFSFLCRLKASDAWDDVLGLSSVSYRLAGWIRVKGPYSPTP